MTRLRLLRKDRAAHAAKVIIYAVVLGMLVGWGLSGCKQQEGNQSQAEAIAQGVAVYHDYGTGCDYVSADSTHSALTPRIAADGRSHMGCASTQQGK